MNEICTHMVAMTFLTGFFAAMVAVLKFAPIEAGLAGVIPNFEPTKEQQKWISNRPPPVAPTKAPTKAPTSESGNGAGGYKGTDDLEWWDQENDFDEIAAGDRYNFMQCKSNTECCNGSKWSCGLRLDQVAIAMVHNAMSTKETSNSFGYNHLVDIDQALRFGYRGINLDVCKCNGVIQFCHNFCNFGARDATDVFQDLMQFLRSKIYLTEVIVLVFQFSTGNPELDDLYRVMEGVDGFTDMLYVHGEKQEWPLMRELLAKNKRIVAFHHESGTDCSTEECPPGFHNYFDYAADTPFDLSSLNEMNDVGNSCQVSRGPQKEADFYNINSFVTPPSIELAREINSKDFVRRRLNRCAEISGMIPNFYSVDFHSKGDVPEVVQSRNVAFAQAIARR